MDVLRVRLVRKLFIWDWGFLVINIDLNFEHASEIILFLRESSLMNGLKFQLPSASSRPSQSLVLQKLKSSNSQMDVIRCIPLCVLPSSGTKQKCVTKKEARNFLLAR